MPWERARVKGVRGPEEFEALEECAATSCCVRTERGEGILKPIRTLSTGSHKRVAGEEEVTVTPSLRMSRKEASSL